MFLEAARVVVVEGKGVRGGGSMVRCRVLLLLVLVKETLRGMIHGALSEKDPSFWIEKQVAHSLLA